MKILIDINHPAHVHYFKNFIKIMKNEEHEIFVTARDRYPVKELLEAYNIPYFNRGKGRNSKIGKLMYMVYADIIILMKSVKFKPDLLISFGTVYTTHVSKIIRKPSILIDDTDHASLNRRFYLPFATNVLTPDIFKHDLGEKQIKFKGYMELAYLHPKYFKTKGFAHEILGIEMGEPYVIIRFVNWQANHDYGHNGISIDNKIKAVKEFRKYAKVFITSEKELPSELEEYRIQIEPHLMHEVISSAKLLYGESATMASESAVLGVPSIFIDNDGRCYTDEEESKYDIVYNFTESENDVKNSIEKAINILESDKNYEVNRKKILEEKISFTDYLLFVVKNYPQSMTTLKEDTSYQDRFLLGESY